MTDREIGLHSWGKKEIKLKIALFGNVLSHSLFLFREQEINLIMIKNHRNFRFEKNLTFFFNEGNGFIEIL